MKKRKVIQIETAAKGNYVRTVWEYIRLDGSRSEILENDLPVWLGDMLFKGIPHCSGCNLKESCEFYGARWERKKIVGKEIILPFVDKKEV